MDWKPLAVSSTAVVRAVGVLNCKASGRSYSTHLNAFLWVSRFHDVAIARVVLEFWNAP